jgi:hypothetical protein
MRHAEGDLMEPETMNGRVLKNWSQEMETAIREERWDDVEDYRSMTEEWWASLSTEEQERLQDEFEANNPDMTPFYAGSHYLGEVPC